MKNIKFAIVTFAVTVLVSSCYDFLEERPKNQIVVDNFFNRPEDIRSMVNGIYSTGALAKYNSGGYQREIMLGGYLSGFFENERAERPGPNEANQLTLNSSNLDEYMATWWDRSYSSIANSNTVIKYIDAVPNLSQSERNQLLAQALFFRAFNYFHLVRDFGDVSLVLEPYDRLENIYIGRDPIAKVYDQIITDLKWALDNGGLPDIPFIMNKYRITKGVIATTLADVYLHSAGYPLQGGIVNYARAADAARVVINSGQHRLIENGETPEKSAYSVMRTSRNEREYIFCYEFDPTHRSTNSYPALTMPRSAKPAAVKINEVWIGYKPLPSFMRVYKPDVDLRIQNRQLWHNNITHNGIVYEFGENIWAPYTWYDEIAIYETNRWTKDIRINTYSEVLLIAAESIAQSEGVTNEAVSYLSDVRSRAYWKVDRNQIESELAGLSKEQFIREVWKERLRELPLHFKIWTDIQRTRMYPVTTASNPGEVNFVNVIGATNPFGHMFEEKHLLYPIAERVLQSNPKLTSNGY
jgi:starch-binding outer membrane protein, SusD/RagB family